MKKLFIVCLALFALIISAPLPALAEAAASQPGELWAKRCQDFKAADGKTVAGQYCEIFQRLALQKKDSKTLERLVEFAVGYPPGEKTARAVIVLPLGIMVQDALTLILDDKDNNAFHVRYCQNDGCYAFLELQPEILKFFSKAQKMTIKARASNGQNLNIIMGLNGFDKALTAIKPKM